MVHNEVNKFTIDRYSELPNFITRQQLRQQNNKITYHIACVTLYTLYCQFNNKIPARKTNVAAKTSTLPVSSGCRVESVLLYSSLHALCYTRTVYNQAWTESPGPGFL